MATQTGEEGMDKVKYTEAKKKCKQLAFNYLLTYDSYGPVYNRFYRGEWITWASGGRGPWTLLGP